MSIQIEGAFQVTFSPLAADSAIRGAFGRLAFNKTFEGELAGTSQGYMVSYRSETAGSAGYTAFEAFSGTLAGRSGSFVLQHSGVMDRGTASLSVHVMPDSGQGELTGLRGTMDIIVEDGKHRYVFAFAGVEE